MNLSLHRNIKHLLRDTRFILAVVVFVTVILSGCIQSYTEANKVAWGIESIKLSWGNITDEYTEIIPEVKVIDPLPINIPLNNIKVEVFMNDILMGEGYAIDDTTISPPNDTIKISVKLLNSRFIDWWVSHIKNGEKTSVKIKIYPIFKFFNFKLKIPFEMTREYKTAFLSLASPVSKSLEIGGIKAVEVIGARLSWGKIDKNCTEIVVSGLVRNNMPVPIFLKYAEYNITTNGVVITQSKMKDIYMIRPKSQDVIRFSIKINNTKIYKWWISHIRNGEKTEVDVNATMKVLIGGKERTLEVYTYKYNFTTDLAGYFKFTEI